jgi:hypothetical protein
VFREPWISTRLNVQWAEAIAKKLASQRSSRVLDPLNLEHILQEGYTFVPLH